MQGKFGYGVICVLVLRLDMISDVTSQGQASWALQKAMIQLLGASRLSTTSPCFSSKFWRFRWYQKSGSFRFIFWQIYVHVWCTCHIIFLRISGLNIMISPLLVTWRWAIGHVDFPGSVWVESLATTCPHTSSGELGALRVPSSHLYIWNQGSIRLEILIYWSQRFQHLEVEDEGLIYLPEN